jgi:hypothetical protein
MLQDFLKTCMFKIFKRRGLTPCMFALVYLQGYRSHIIKAGETALPGFPGGPSRARTWDLLIKSQLLYQLS